MRRLAELKCSGLLSGDTAIPGIFIGGNGPRYRYSGHQFTASPGTFSLHSLREWPRKRTAFQSTFLPQFRALSAVIRGTFLPSTRTPSYRTQGHRTTAFPGMFTLLNLRFLLTKSLRNLQKSIYKYKNRVMVLLFEGESHG